jgi:catechol 2,3-dioxygenase-like lactoylglutathione lyase family enzyme
MSPTKDKELPMSKREISLKVHRPHLLVSDMERSYAIYRDILGFRVNKIADGLAVAYRMFDVDPTKGRLRVSFLGDDHSPFGAIALTELKGVDLPATRTPYVMNVIIEVPEEAIEQKIELLRNAGLDVSEPFVIVDPPPERTDYVFNDPDGHRIVLFALHRKKVE